MSTKEECIHHRVLERQKNYTNNSPPKENIIKQLRCWGSGNIFPLNKSTYSDTNLQAKLDCIKNTLETQKYKAIWQETISNAEFLWGEAKLEACISPQVVHDMSVSLEMLQMSHLLSTYTRGTLLLPLKLLWRRFTKRSQNKTKGHQYGLSISNFTITFPYPREGEERVRYVEQDTRLPTNESKRETAFNTFRQYPN